MSRQEEEEDGMQEEEEREIVCSSFVPERKGHRIHISFFLHHAILSLLGLAVHHPLFFSSLSQ